MVLVAVGTGLRPLNLFPLDVYPETLWDPPWLPASLRKRLLMWPSHYLLCFLMPLCSWIWLFLLFISISVCFCIFLTSLLAKIIWDHLYHFITYHFITGADQLIVSISKHCRDSVEISLVVSIFLCLEKCTMSHWAQLNLQAPCSCHSSCSDVLFPTAVVEYNIQTNQAELTTLWLGGGSGSGERILWNADTKIWVSGLDLWNWDCGQLACQLMRWSYILGN